MRRLIMSLLLLGVIVGGAFVLLWYEGAFYPGIKMYDVLDAWVRILIDGDYKFDMDGGEVFIWSCFAYLFIGAICLIILVFRFLLANRVYNIGIPLFIAALILTGGYIYYLFDNDITINMDFVQDMWTAFIPIVVTAVVGVFGIFVARGDED